MITSCTHDFSYLLKSDEKRRMYTGRVLELPAVIVQGKKLKDIDSKIKKATLDYLKTFTDEHKLAREGKLTPCLETPCSGLVIKTEPFQITC